jgi:hypothetical protein
VFYQQNGDANELDGFYYNPGGVDSQQQFNSNSNNSSNCIGSNNSSNYNSYDSTHTSLNNNSNNNYTISNNSNSTPSHLAAAEPIDADPNASATSYHGQTRVASPSGGSQDQQLGRE